MRKVLLATLFALCVSQLCAQPCPTEPPIPLESIVWDTNYTKITTNANGDYVLTAGAVGYGKVNTKYFGWMVAYDKNGGTYEMIPKGDVQPFWYWPNNYDGSIMSSEFSYTVLKDSKYWKEIDWHGTAKISVYLYQDVGPPAICVSVDNSGKLTLP